MVHRAAEGKVLCHPLPVYYSTVCGEVGCDCSAEHAVEDFQIFFFLHFLALEVRLLLLLLLVVPSLEFRPGFLGLLVAFTAWTQSVDSGRGLRVAPSTDEQWAWCWRWRWSWRRLRDVRVHRLERLAVVELGLYRH